MLRASRPPASTIAIAASRIRSRESAGRDISTIFVRRPGRGGRGSGVDTNTILLLERCSSTTNGVRSPAMTALASPPPPTTTTATDAPAGHARRWAILALVLAVECMDLIDGTIVNVAAPSIRLDLGSSLSALQWIAGGYALTFAVGLVTGGRLGDIFGRKRLFLAGVAGFMTASLLCGLAPSTEALIGFRLLQGAFAALMIPQGFGIIRAAFGPDEIGKAFALFGPVI